MLMKPHTIMLSVCLCVTYLAYSQNLVTNFDFSIKEPGTGCPSSTGFHNGRPTGWLQTPFHGYSPTIFILAV